VASTGKELNREEQAARAVAPVRPRGWDRLAGAQTVRAGLVATIAILGLYYVYRYPLRLNIQSEGSSYSATPTGLQIGKYALLAAVAIVFFAPALIRLLRERVRWRAAEVVLAATGSFALVRATVALIETGTTDSLNLLAPVFALVPGAVVVGLSLDLPQLRNGLGQLCAGLAAAMLALHAIANVVQFGLWQLTGRLPALGYEDVIARFGGVWDDPNACAAYSAGLLLALLVVPLPISRWTRLGLEAAALFNLTVAWSYSAWVFLAVGLAVLFGRRPGWPRRAAIVGIAAGMALVVVVLAVGPADVATRVPVVGDSLSRNIAAKQESADQRLGLDSYVERPPDVLSWVVGSSQPNQIESALGNWFAASGLIGTGLLVAWLSLALRRLAWPEPREWVVPMTVGFLIASSFVPYLVVFPVAGIFVLALALSSSYSQRSVRTPAPPSSAGASS
jgi:hypothetical protein